MAFCVDTEPFCVRLVVDRLKADGGGAELILSVSPIVMRVL